MNSRFHFFEAEHELEHFLIIMNQQGVEKRASAQCTNTGTVNTIIYFVFLLPKHCWLYFGWQSLVKHKYLRKPVKIVSFLHQKR